LGSSIASGEQICTPPTASTIALNPEKSTITVLSTRMPVSCSNCWMVHAAPPTS